MAKAISLQKALRVLQGTPSKSNVEVFIDYVNSCFATKESMLRYRCSPNMGHFYQLGVNLLEVTPAQCLEIEKEFRGAGWKDVQVVYWMGALSISLETFQSRGWVSHYNGDPLDAGAYGPSSVLPRSDVLAGAQA